VPGICVYLPPGYETSGLRYPVVYLLHGGLGGGHEDWFRSGQAQAILDDAYRQNPSHAVIAVADRAHSTPRHCKRSRPGLSSTARSGKPGSTG